MSVPAHAPFDYQALVDFKKNQPPGLELQLIKPISIIETEGYGEIPAKEAVEKLGISRTKMTQSLKRQLKKSMEKSSTVVY